MANDLIWQLLLFAVLTSASINGAVWSVAGLCRKLSEFFSPPPREARMLSSRDVAILIAARNEESALPSCLAAARAIVPSWNIFVGNDASTDATARVVRSNGSNVYTAPVNVGKSRVLDATVRNFDLTSRFQAVLILDADSQVDPDFLRNALPLLEQPGTAVVAGHFVSRRPAGFLGFGQTIHNYRKRLYVLLQTFFRFGQTWAPINFSIVAPGFASLYRSDVLKQLDIAATGLVIEDINMTFEVHKKRLGRIAYSPAVRCTTEDPTTVRDYAKQMRRWSLGLWQTIGKQGVWASKFWLILVFYILEVLLNSLWIAAMAIASVWAIVVSHADSFWFPTVNGVLQLPILYLPLLLLAGDLFMSLVAAVLMRDWRIFVYAPLYPLLRLIDVHAFLVTLIQAFFTKSDGRWSSPARNAARTPLQPRQT